MIVGALVSATVLCGGLQNVHVRTAGCMYVAPAKCKVTLETGKGEEGKGGSTKKEFLICLAVVLQRCLRNHFELGWRAERMTGAEDRFWCFGACRFDR